MTKIAQWQGPLAFESVLKREAKGSAVLHFQKKEIPVLPWISLSNSEF